MAATILLLAGPGGAYYNHQILFVDGGETRPSPFFPPLASHLFETPHPAFIPPACWGWLPSLARGVAHHSLRRRWTREILLMRRVAERFPIGETLIEPAAI